MPVMLIGLSTGERVESTRSVSDKIIKERVECSTLNNFVAVHGLPDLVSCQEAAIAAGNGFTNATFIDTNGKPSAVWDENHSLELTWKEGDPLWGVDLIDEKARKLAEEARKSEDEDEPEGPKPETMTVPQLREFAAEQNIDIEGLNTKPKILEKIQTELRLRKDEARFLSILKDWNEADLVLAERDELVAAAEFGELFEDGELTPETDLVAAILEARKSEGGGEE